MHNLPSLSLIYINIQEMYIACKENYWKIYGWNFRVHRKHNDREPGGGGQYAPDLTKTASCPYSISIILQFSQDPTPQLIPEAV
jgi:hypothetical protein